MNARVLLVIPFACAFAAARAEDMKAKLQPLYDQMAQATMKKDAEAWKKLARRYLASDFVYIHHDGKRQTTARMLVEMESMSKSVGPFTRSSMRIESAKGNAKAAILVVVTDWATTLKDKEGKVHKVEGSERTEDSWVAQGLGWKLKRIATKSSVAKMDGKVISG